MKAVKTQFWQPHRNSKTTKRYLEESSKIIWQND